VIELLINQQIKNFYCSDAASAFLGHQQLLPALAAASAAHIGEGLAGDEGGLLTLSRNQVSRIFRFTQA